LNTDRIWNQGPPPHIGWWNASISHSSSAWRWWNGSHWSFVAYDDYTATRARHQAAKLTRADIEWTDYYPVDARVARVAP